MATQKLIGIFATDISSRVQSSLYEAIHQKATTLGYHLVMFSGTTDNTDLHTTATITYHLLDLAEQMNFAAFLIHAQSIAKPEMVSRIMEMGKRKNIPVFLYDSESAGITDTEGSITINPDYKQGFADGVKHLIEVHHCKNIYMLGGLKDNKYSDDRIDMYRQEMEAHGIPYAEEQIGYGDFWEIPATDAVNRFLDSDLPKPDAICCANDSMAIAACKTLRKRGLKVPEDVLVAGFDGIEDGKLNEPNISTSEPKLDAVADFIFGVLEEGRQEKEFLVPLEFTPKESCGCGYHNSIADRREMARLVENTRQSNWQEYMLSIMQVRLMDSSLLSDNVDYMKGLLDLFKSYDHLICFRNDIECCADYTEGLSKMRVHLNKGMLPERNYEHFDVEELMPDFEQMIENSPAESIFVFKLVFCAEKLFGYHVVRTGEYISHEIELFEHCSENFSNIVENTLRNMRLKNATQKLNEMYEQMSEIYIKDTMTGIYNRHGYYQKLDEYLQREDLKDGYMHIISVDMDGMKKINDNYGHLEGDNAIKAVAATIRDCFAQPCITARFGGDEFMIALFTSTEEEPTTDKISQKLNTYVKTLPMLADKEYTVGISVGQAIVKVSEIADIKLIEKLADDAMYINKRDRKKQR